MRNILGSNFTTNLLRISKKNHNSVMFDNLDLREISLFSIGFLECGRCPKYKGSINVFGQKCYFFHCYVKRFSTSVAIRVYSLLIFYCQISSWKTKKTLPYIHVAYYSRSFRSLSVCWVLNKRAPLPNFVFFPAQNWPSNWSYTNFNYFPSTFVEKEKENLSDNGDQFTWNLSTVYRST